MKRIVLAGLFAASALAMPSAHAATVVQAGTVSAFGVDYISFFHSGGGISIHAEGLDNSTSVTELLDPMIRLFTLNGASIGTQVGVADNGFLAYFPFFTLDPTLTKNPLASGNYILAVGRSFLTENEARTGQASGPLWSQGYKTTFTSDVAVQVGGAVPEPATWAMMIAGFGLVGAGMRRRAPKVTVTYA